MHLVWQSLSPVGPPNDFFPHLSCSWKDKSSINLACLPSQILHLSRNNKTQIFRRAAFYFSFKYHMIRKAALFSSPLDSLYINLHSGKKKKLSLYQSVQIQLILQSLLEQPVLSLMEKSFEIDFDEWELLPDTRHTFIDLGLESEKGLLFSKDIDIHYFSNDKNSSPLIEEKEVCKDISVVPPPPEMPMIVADHGDVASIVLFKKSRDDDFVDMKIESPKTYAKATIMPPVEPEQMFESECEEEEEELYKDEKSSEKEIEYEEPEINKKHNSWEGFGLKVWRWRVAGGVGALCSIGVAAATLCIFILGGKQLQKNQNQNQKIQFQIYTDEKRIKQVMQQATRLTDALSAVRGAPMTRARISFGGYYDGL